MRTASHRIFDERIFENEALDLISDLLGLGQREARNDDIAAAGPRRVNDETPECKLALDHILRYVHVLNATQRHDRPNVLQNPVLPVDFLGTQGKSPGSVPKAWPCHAVEECPYQYRSREDPEGKRRVGRQQMCEVVEQGRKKKEGRDASHLDSPHAPDGWIERPDMLVQRHVCQGTIGGRGAHGREGEKPVRKAVIIEIKGLPEVSARGSRERNRTRKSILNCASGGWPLIRAGSYHEMLGLKTPKSLSLVLDQQDPEN